MVIFIYGKGKKMQHIDERILALRHKNKCRSGAKAKEKTEPFFDGLIEIVLPDDFSDMKEEMIQKSFLADESPAYARITSNGEVVMTLDMLESHEPLDKVLEQSRQLIKVLYPGSVIYENGIINELTGWFDCKIFLEKETYYKLCFVVEKHDKKIFGSFQCRFKNYDRWKLQMINILNQIS